MKNPKFWLWVIIGGIAGFVVLHFIGLGLGLIGGGYIGTKIPKR